MKSGRCLVLGMSHVTAISGGIPESDREKVKFYKLTANDIELDVDELERKFGELNSSNDRADVQGETSLFLSILGNTYNVLGLIENPVPFNVHGCSQETGNIERTAIPKEMMRDHFLSRLNPWIKNIQIICERFAHFQIYMICSPPPGECAEHIKKFPGFFKGSLDMGIAPAGLRKNLYELQTEIFSDNCKKLGIPIIDPPQQALCEHGFLKEEYRNNDPTHANAKYGALVWEQMKAEVNV